MKISEEELLKDLKKLDDLMKTSKSINEYFRYYQYFHELSLIYYGVSGMEYTPQKCMFLKDKRLEKYYDNLGKKENNDFLMALMREKDFIKECSKSYIMMYDKSLDISHSNKIKEYSEKEFQDIIFSFFNSFGEEEYKIIKSAFDLKHIGYGIEDEYFSFGACCLNVPFTSSSYITTPYVKKDLQTMYFITHELGHYIEANKIIFPQGKVNKTNQEILGEVSSTFFELEFIEYLKKNKIEASTAKEMGDFGYYNLSSYLSDLFFHLDTLPRKINNMEFDDIQGCTYYGMSYYVVLHLMDIYENDKEHFKKLFYTLLSSRETSTIEENLRNLGFNIDEFTRGELIKERVKMLNK